LANSAAFSNAGFGVDTTITSQSLVVATMLSITSAHCRTRPCVASIIDNIKTKNPSEVWSCTSNSTFSMNTFEEYMEWFDKLIDDLKNSDTCGHAHERSISFFYFIHNKNVVMVPNVITHLQLDSHKTQGHFVDFDNSMKNLLSN
jgi:hypothetical protein